MSAVGEQLRELRLAHGVSQAELARRAGTTQAVVSRVERGLQSPTVAMAQRLHHGLGRRMVVSSQPLPAVDPLHLAEERRLSMSARLERAFAWMQFTAQLHGAAHGGRRD